MKRMMFLCLSGLLSLTLTHSSLLAQEERLPRDPNNIYGTFDNGLDYIVRKSSNPPGRVAMWVHVGSGALAETDSQNGIAHFLEHMAFNGSTSFPPGELIPFMDNLGMQFGSGANAHTAKHETVYKLFMPGNDEEMIGHGFRILFDWCNELLLTDEEIVKERDVILEEARTRKGVGQRMNDELWPRLFPNSHYARHDIIGIEQQIKTFPRAEFVDFYNTWYRPKNMALIIVGDVDPAAIVERAKSVFGSFEARAPQRPEPAQGIKSFDHARAIVLTDPEQPSAVVQMMAIRAGRPPITTYSQYRFNEFENLGPWMVSRRLQNLVTEGKADFSGANVGVNGIFNEAILPMAVGVGEPVKWKGILEQLVTETNRAIQHGFNEAELSLAKEALLSNARRGVQISSTLDAQQHISGISSSVGSDSPILSAEQNLALLERIMKEATLENVHRIFVDNYKTSNFTYVMMLPEKDGISVPTEEQVLKVATAAWEKSVDKKEEEASDVTLLEKLPEPGKVASKTHDEELDVTQIVFENGVKLTHKFMDYKENQVFVQVTLPAGTLQETAANHGVAQVANLMNATSRLTSTQIRDLSATKNVQAGIGVGLDTVTMSITGAPEDLEHGFQLVYAQLTDGKIEASAFKNWKDQVKQSLEVAESNPGYQLSKAMDQTVHGNDPRFAQLTAKDLDRLTPAAAESWFKSVVKGAPMEVAVVGDYSLDKATALVSRYFGSLPKATRSFDCLDPLRKIERAEGPYAKRIEFETITPQAIVLAGFIGCAADNTPDRRKLTVAQMILSNRMNKRIREELQLVYSIGCQNRPNDAIGDLSLFMAAAPTDPAKSEQLATEIVSMMEAFAKEGPTDEEMEVANKQIQEALDKQLKEPGFWFNVLSDMNYRGRSMDEIKQLPGVYATFTKDQVKEISAKYFTKSRMVRLLAVPKTGEE